MEELKEFWNDYGWVANIFTILLGVVTFAGFIKYLFSRLKAELEWRNKYSSILNYVEDNCLDESVRGLKKRRLAIIDDHPEHYPLEYLRHSGWNITVYEKVSLADIDYIRNFDLVFLDITNVVKEDPKRGGFELIKRVRKEIQNIVIIGVSSKTFDPTLTEFFRLADEQARTPIAEKDCEELILTSLEKKYSPKHIAKNIDNMLDDSQLAPKERQKAVRAIIRNINQNLSDGALYKTLSVMSQRLDTYRLQQSYNLLKESLCKT